MSNTLADIFGDPAFNMLELTNAINVIPNRWGRISELGVFGAGKGVTTSSILIERNKQSLNLIPSAPRGAPSTQNVNGKRDARSLTIPFFPHEDQVTAQDVAGVRAFGSANQFETVQMKVAEKLNTLRMKHALTKEWLQAGALKGVIYDADGSSILLDLFTEFGISQQTVFFDLANAAADIDGKISAVVRHIEDNLLGDRMSYVHALCSPEFFDDLTKHPKVREAYMHFADRVNVLRQDVRSGFFHKGVMWEEYRGSASHLQADNTSVTRRFIPAGDVRFFPMGTTQTFDMAYAPGEFIETVNTVGRELYVKTAIEKYGRWVDLHSQSSPLPYCMRPAVLVRGSKEAA